MNNILLNAINVNKSFEMGTQKVQVLKNLNLQLEAKKTIGIMGSSGSGKSTLLHILAGLDRADSGDILFENRTILDLNDSQLSAFRNQNIGFIYQFHHLLNEFNALENILMPILIQRKLKPADYNKALELLDVLGLGARSKHLPSQMSGGERQRVAIARAMIKEPKIIFADEPTGNLDYNSARQVLEALFNLQNNFNSSLVIVTHDKEIANLTHQQYRLFNGELSNA